MPEMTSDQAQYLSQFLLSTFRHESQVTARVFAAIPADQSHFKPDEISMSAFDLASHMAKLELRFLRGISAGQFGSPDAPLPQSVATGSSLADWYAAEVKSAADTVAGLTGEQLSKVISFGGVFEMPAVHYLSIAVRHSVHHRGQLSTYLRLMGAKVPAIYGESYDSKREKAT